MIGENLKDLFSLFYFSQLEDLSIPNCGQKPEAFCMPRKLWETDQGLIDNYLVTLTTACGKKAVNPPQQPFPNEPRLESFYLASVQEIVSGKFWLAMLFHYVKNQYNIGSITFDSFTFRIAKNCNFDNLNWLVESVMHVYPQHQSG
ncbi:hypothetical protein J2D73_09190 [Acetobacter sacchari]|uniref:Uncharacterized protein n=1 Tax=Acetobacter sacchari TaxID=2661687 RepID=A0ABS3LVM0_9PROT|nr:hypothetical protein [Acetobacter sacchari]MBO1359968.1 hypothetical protein [Acetobacter sacchari]